MRGINTAQPFRFLFELNSVETALKFERDLIAKHTSKVDLDFGPGVGEISLSVLENQQGDIASFMMVMHGSDRESEAQKFQAKLSYLAPGPNNDSTHAMVFEDVWLHSHRLLGFSYTGQSPVEHEIVLRFVTPGS